MKRKYKTCSATTAKTQTRYIGEKLPLHAKGNVVGVQLGNDASYFGTDIIGSVRSVTDGVGSVKDLREYDVFGNPLETDGYNGGLEYGYAGKPYDAVTEMYNYGFRDYSPATARFTTLDPIRDGTNWFSYVANDPVNFVDLWGLMANDVKKNLIYNPILSGSKIRRADTSITMTSNPDIVDLQLGEGDTTLGKSSCTLLSYTRIASVLAGESISLKDANDYAKAHNLFTNKDELTIENGIKLTNGLLEKKAVLGVSVSLEVSLKDESMDTIRGISKYTIAQGEYFGIARIETTSEDGTETYGHSLNLAEKPIRNDPDIGNLPNIYYDDTSGVRTKHYAGERDNTLQRVDILKVNRTLIGE